MEEFEWIECRVNSFFIGQGRDYFGEANIEFDRRLNIISNNLAETQMIKLCDKILIQIKNKGMAGSVNMKLAIRDTFNDDTGEYHSYFDIDQKNKWLEMVNRLKLELENSIIIEEGEDSDFWANRKKMKKYREYLQNCAIDEKNVDLSYDHNHLIDACSNILYSNHESSIKFLDSYVKDLEYLLNYGFVVANENIPDEFRNDVFDIYEIIDSKVDDFKNLSRNKKFEEIEGKNYMAYAFILNIISKDYSASQFINKFNLDHLDKSVLTKKKSAFKKKEYRLLQDGQRNNKRDLAYKFAGKFIEKNFPKDFKIFQNEYNLYINVDS